MGKQVGVFQSQTLFNVALLKLWRWITNCIIFRDYDGFQWILELLFLLHEHFLGISFVRIEPVGALYENKIESVST